VDKILFVTYLRPCPPYGGELIRCYNLIDSLCQHYDVILLAPRVEVDCELNQKVYAWHNLPQRRRSLRILNVLNGIRYISTPYPDWARRLEAACQQFRPQVTWFEGYHWGQYVTTVDRFGSRAIMGTANRQSELTRQQLGAMPPNLLYPFVWGRYQAERRHEHNLFRRFDRIVSVSEADRQYHAQFVGQAHSKLIPNYVNEAWYQLDKPVARADDTVVATASFNSYQNRAGAEWLLKKVWPQVCQQLPGAQLQLVGRGSENLVAQTNPLPGVTCVGEVPTVVPYLRRATISVVPILHGSGTRFKILESLACNLPVVSTTLGAEGIEVVSGESTILADSAADFARAIVELLKDEAKRTRLAQNGLTVLRRNYGFEVNTERIQQIVEELITE
jgi:glycosyltransferase involved in cell wall biosynthesis